MNHENPSKQDHGVLRNAFNRSSPEEFTELTFCGSVNAIRLRHPHVTPSLMHLWIALMKACSRANARLRYPHQIEKVKHHFDDALSLKTQGVDFSADDFDLEEWIAQNEEAISMLLDMRLVHVALHEAEDILRLLRHLQTLTSETTFGNIVFAEPTRRAMLKYAIDYTREVFSKTLQGWGVMTKTRHVAACQSIRTELTRLGVSRELAGSRAVGIQFGGDEITVTVKSVPELVDLQWESFIEDAAAGAFWHGGGRCGAS